jgi:uncharacterized protein (TIGR02246 family)
MRILLVVLLGTDCLASQVVRAADLKTDIEAAYGAWNEAFNKGDAAGLASFYTDDATFLPPTHEVITGPAGIEQFFAGLFDAGVSNHGLEVITVKGDADADLVYSAANWTATGKAEDGSEQSVGGIAVHGFERQPDGSLKLNLHTFN